MAISPASTSKQSGESSSGNQSENRRDSAVSDSYVYKEALRRSAAVCQIVARSDEKTKEVAGTAFLIGHRLLMTNHHVLPSKEIVERSYAVFEYDPGGGKVPFEINLTRLLIASPSPGNNPVTDKCLDYAIVELEDHPSLKKISSAAFSILDTVKSQPACTAVIVHHPLRAHQPSKFLGGREITKGKVTTVKDLEVHYSADTVPGSSGGPIIASVETTNRVFKRKLSALHRAKCDQHYNCRIGVPMSVIVKDLETQGLASEVEASYALLEQYLKDHSLPPSVNLSKPLVYFIGREKLFKDLHNKFSANPQSMMTHVHLFGPPGIGKTEFTLKFAETYRQHFSFIAYVSADLYDQHYRELAEALKLPIEKASPEEILRKVHRRLEQGFEKPYLLILDNVRQELSLPQQKGCILTTSIQQNIWENVDEEKEVLPINKLEAQKLLSCSLGNKAIKDLEGWEILTEKLGGFPLLLDLARKYIVSTHSTVRQYLEKIEEEHPAWQVNSGPRYPRPLFITYAITLGHLNTKNSKAFGFLQLCAYFNPARIDHSFLDLWLNQLWPGQPNAMQKGEIIRDLESLSLIRYQDETETFSLHSILQLILHRNHEQSKQCAENVNQTAQLIKKKLEGFDPLNSKTWELGYQCFGHIESLKSPSCFAYWNSVGPRTQWGILKSLGIWLQEAKSNPSQNLQYLEEALQLSKTIHKDTLHVEVAETLRDLADAWRFNDRYTRAEELLKQSLKILQHPKVFGDEPSSSVAATLNQLGNVYRDLSRPEEALEYHMEALKMFKQVFGDEPSSSVAATLNNLGNVYRDLSRPEEALEYHMEALKMFKQVFGGEPSSSVATTLCCLGNVYRNLSQPEEALKYYIKDLEMSKQVFGDELSSSVAITLCNLGTVYRDMSRPEGALECLLEALEMSKQVFGDEPSSSVAAILHRLGTVYKDLSQPQKALESFKQASEMYGDLNQPQKALKPA